MKAVKKYYPLFLPPLLTLAVMLYVFKNYNMYPFGQGSIAWCDMNQQGIPLLMDFKDMLSGKDNLFFSMNNAGGMSFWGVFCFFLSNRQCKLKCVSQEKKLRLAHFSFFTSSDIMQ